VPIAWSPPPDGPYGDVLMTIDTDAPPLGGWWFAVDASVGPDGHVAIALAQVRTDQHPREARIGVPSVAEFVIANEQSVIAVIRGCLTVGRVVAQTIETLEHGHSGEFVPAPSLGYVYNERPGPESAMRHLLAFVDLPDGQMLSADEAQARGVDPTTQVAAVEWSWRDGLVNQLYVAPAWRRKGIATRILRAAELICALQGNPPLHGGALRTDLGDDFLRAAPASWEPRLHERTGTAPPMTPP
jgi:GNAT superfamily N-acetyltransferase